MSSSFEESGYGIPIVFPSGLEVLRGESSFPAICAVCVFFDARHSDSLLCGNPVFRSLVLLRRAEPCEHNELVVGCIFPFLVGFPEDAGARSVRMAGFDLNEANALSVFGSSEQVVIGEVLRQKGIWDAAL